MTTPGLAGLVFLIAVAAVVPFGWIVSHKILLLAVLFIGDGAWFFYTARMLNREEQFAKKSTAQRRPKPFR